ncbi:MAG TPA: hypothetical protein VGC76_07595 [Pyrinomonadaceae bacterium]|jgi:hypothetical protein
MKRPGVYFTVFLLLMSFTVQTVFGGVWYLHRTTEHITVYQFGIAVYRNGIWWIVRSQSENAEAFAWGISTDKPVPSAFVR